MEFVVWCFLLAISNPQGGFIPTLFERFICPLQWQQCSQDFVCNIRATIWGRRTALRHMAALCQCLTDKMNSCSFQKCLPCFNCLVPACTSHTPRATTGTTARPDSSDGYEAIEGPTILHWEFLMTDSWKKIRNENECCSNWAIYWAYLSASLLHGCCAIICCHHMSSLWFDHSYH